MERLRATLDPAHTALLTMEVQRGVVGDMASLRGLADVCDEIGLVDSIAEVARHARAAGVKVVHCPCETRADGVGFVENCRIFAMVGKIRNADGTRNVEQGSESAAIMPEVLDPSDVVVGRITGMSPFMSTQLDQVLRNIGIKTVIATGVSVNLGIFGMTLNAIDLGYQAVVVRDAVAGVPMSYANDVIDNSLINLATILTKAELFEIWDSMKS